MFEETVDKPFFDDFNKKLITDSNSTNARMSTYNARPPKPVPKIKPIPQPKGI